MIIAEILIGAERAWGVRSLNDFITFFIFIVFRVEIEEIEAALIHVKQFIGMNIRHIKKFAEYIQQLFPLILVLAHAGSLRLRWQHAKSTAVYACMIISDIRKVFTLRGNQNLYFMIRQKFDS